MNVFPDVKQPGFDFDAYNRRFHDANIIINGTTRSMAYDPHWGPLSIKAAKGGSEFYKSGDALYRVDGSSLLIFNEGKYYESWIDAPEPVETLTLNMTPAFERQALEALKATRNGIIDPYDSVERIRFTERLYSSTPRLECLIHNMRTLACNLKSNHPRIQELFFDVFVEMVGLQEGSDREALATGKTRASSRTELYRRLLIAKDYLHACFNEDVVLYDLARVACLNPYYLLRQFKRVFKITPHQYLTQLRLAEAEKLLMSEVPVENVCHAVGFQDPSSFTKLFRRHTGYTPTSFRSRLFR